LLIVLVILFPAGIAGFGARMRRVTARWKRSREASAEPDHVTETVA
jgi:hypothetical protein